ncbi:hypothetical protein [Pseudomonas benzenivorans]|uniref:Cytochrome c domain-containing protein n=1 Tax=Pseudomonas benzenivorans TaxID=556533 RepID=A0ABY5HCT6_9PSED|nr:hypothetical protein [Pseudomonas benzenivorans]UTW09652.1 hypothetical protein KDW96_10245 [Pseudomonas benzenivorans]
MSWWLAALGAALGLASTASLARPATGPSSELPALLSETGLFAPGSRAIASGLLAFAPQYPLWTDGAEKRRWLSLPPDAAIDASTPDAWTFPKGTRLWKEFAYAGQPVETRFIERLVDGSWRYAAYIWAANGEDATLAPAEGVTLAVAAAPSGRYAVPSRDDCRGCHEAGPVPVLGCSALQLSPDRDGLALHGATVETDPVDLEGLLRRGLLRNLPRDLLDQPPRIAARSPTERAALGYLHGNCGHCHNASGPLALLELSLTQGAGSAADAERSLRTTLGRLSESRLKDLDTRIVPGDAARSLLLARMRSRNPVLQMPPLGTAQTDAQANALIERWIEHELPFLEEKSP